MTYEKTILGAAMDDTQRMMQMSGFGMDPTKVNIVSLYYLVFQTSFLICRLSNMNV